jgi:hypothetical protein
MDFVTLENSLEQLYVHPEFACSGRYCTIHNKSDHLMRSFPQHWRADRAIMERICTHGVGHPDPDEYKLEGFDSLSEMVHGCDGCCDGAYDSV